MRIRMIAAIALFLSFLPGILPAQEFGALAEALLSSGPLSGAGTAALFVSAEDGTVLYSRNPDLPLVPASTVKLAVSAAALERLTPDFRFVTTFLRRKDARPGKTLPVLVWRGTGDPSISGRDRNGLYEIYERWADQAGALGVAGIKRLVLDGRYFEDAAVHPSWPERELAYWYQAETSAIAFNDNCIDLEIRSGAGPGRRPEIKLTPDIGYLRVKNKAVTGAGNGPFTLDFSRAPQSNTVVFYGSIPPGRVHKDYAAVHDPASFAAEALRRIWKKKGIGISRITAWEKSGLTEEDLEPLFTWRSEPLSELIKVVNTNSQNLYAEHILKTLGKETAGHGSFAAGTAAVSAYLNGIGLKNEEFHLADGSGLSRENRFTAAGLVKILRRMHGTPLFRIYHDSLATAGKKRRMGGDPVSEGMRLKSGTLASARNLAGYLRSESGKLYAFAVLVNGPELGRDAVDGAVDALCLLAAHKLP